MFGQCACVSSSKRQHGDAGSCGRGCRNSHLESQRSMHCLVGHDDIIQPCIASHPVRIDGAARARCFVYLTLLAIMRAYSSTRQVTTGPCLEGASAEFRKSNLARRKHEQID